MSILEIAAENRYLCLSRGFLRIKESGKIIGDVALDMVTAVITTGHRISYSNSILAEMAERNIPLVICGKDYSPAGMFLSVKGNCRQTEIMKKQVSVSLPFKKNIWKTIVEEKIKNQAKVLDKEGIEHKLAAYYENVKSGDPDNRESTAARVYLPLLYGRGFIRDFEKKGINAYLNYGYAVMRAVLAKYVIAAGLLPAFGIHHKNNLNPFCLVDDIIEPFRPLVDREVYNIFYNRFDDESELTTENKRKLSGLLEKKIHTRDAYSPVRMCMQQTVWSLVDSYKNGKPDIKYARRIID